MLFGENSTTYSNKSLRKCKRKEEMRLWLSLLPPGSHICIICKKIFNSLQTVGEHQNANCTVRIQLQMHDMDMKLPKEEKERRGKIREGKRINDHSHNCTPVVPVVANDHGQSQTCNSTATVPVVANYHHDESKIDLNLHLGFGPPKKVMDFHDFMPIKRVKGDGVGAHSGSRVNYKTYAETQCPHMTVAAYSRSLGFHEQPDTSLRIGVNEGGVGSGGGYLLKAYIASGEPGTRFFGGGKDNMKATSNNQVDLTLKL